MTAAHITLGPRSKPYRCLDCGQEFIWHPGASGLVCAIECGACESPNIEALPVEEPK
jgi:DNA-directed RNA polymerase subunit RPC12/RpoP